MGDYRIVFNNPGLVGRELTYMADAIAQGHSAGNGTYTRRCQDFLEGKLGSSKVFLTTSCTDALELTALLLEIKPGDEVLLPSFTFVSTANAFVLRGATPVFVDIRPDTLNLDEVLIEPAVTSRTRAIMPVHLYGQPADMDGIMGVASRHNLLVIEDCCQAHGATCNGRPIGSFGTAAAYSFYPTKNLAALGDGGAITTADPAIASRIRRLRNGGQTHRYQHGEFGVNSRLDEIQAAVLRARLRWLPKWIGERRQLAAEYRTHLAAAVVTVPPECDPGHVYHLFPILSDERDALQARLMSRGVETLIHYPIPITRQPALRSEGPADCPITDRVCGQLLSLPLHPGMALSAVEEVASALHASAAAS